MESKAGHRDELLECLPPSIGRELGPVRLCFSNNYHLVSRYLLQGSFLLFLRMLYFQRRSVVLFLTHTQALMLEKHHSVIADPSNEPRRQARKYRWVWSSTNQLCYTLLCKGHSSFSHGLEIPYAWKNRNLSAEYALSTAACAFKRLEKQNRY